MSVSLAYDDWQSTDDLLDATLSSLNVALPGNVGDRIGSLVDDLTSKFNSI
jgi:hypothetical protein